MADISKPDLCVIGAGALGIELALQARQQGLAVTLVRQPLHEASDPALGRLRRAAFIASAARAQAMRTASALGLDNVEPKASFRAIAEHAEAIAATAAPAVADARLAALDITVLDDAASFSDQRTLRCGDAAIRARQFVLATGSKPIIPLLPGLDQVPYFTPDTIGDNVRKLSHLVVIGGEPAALELAQAYRRLGSMVTVVPQGDLLAGFDPELAAILLGALRDEGVVIRDEAEVAAIVPRSQGTGVTLRLPEGEDSLNVSHILVAMGRLPLLDETLLGKLRLRRDRLRPERLSLGPDGQTSNGRVTAIGGAAGEFQPDVAAQQAGLVLERLLGRRNGRLGPRQTVRSLATEPALAQFGLLEDDARPGRRRLRANLAENDLARALGRPEGCVTVSLGRDGTVVGAGAVGAGAGDIIALLALAGAQGQPLAELAPLALPKPSLAASIVDLAMQVRTEAKPAAWHRFRALMRR